MGCHTMSCHVIPESSMCHSTTQQLSHSTHLCISFLACVCTAQGRFKDIHDMSMKTQRNMAHSDFLAQLHQLQSSATATCHATGLCFCHFLPWIPQNAKLNSKQQNLTVDMCGSSNGTQWIYMDPHCLSQHCFSTSLSQSWVHWQIGEVQRCSTSQRQFFLVLVSNVSSDAWRRFDDPHCHAHQFGHTILLLRSAMFRGEKRDMEVEISWVCTRFYKYVDCWVRSPEIGQHWFMIKYHQYSSINLNQYQSWIHPYEFHMNPWNRLTLSDSDG